MKRNPFQTRRNQRGLGLVEMAIFVAIAAAIILGALWVGNLVKDKLNVNEEVQTAVLMSNDLRTKFSKQGNFRGLSTANVIDLGVAPADRISGSELRTAWSTSWDVVAANVNGQPDDGHQLVYTDFPAKVCSDFIMGVASNFARVTIDGTTIKDVTRGNNDNEISVDELTLCAGSDGSVGSIVLAQGR